MRKIIPLLAAGALIFSLFLRAEQQEANIFVSLVIGDVKVKQGETGKWEKAKPGKQLTAASILQTGKASKVKILFKDANSEILIPEEKQLKMADLLAKREALQKDKNRMLLNKLKLKLYRESSKDDLDSPTAVAGVRGSDVSKQSNGDSKPEELFWDE